MSLAVGDLASWRDGAGLAHFGRVVEIRRNGSVTLTYGPMRRTFDADELAGPVPDKDGRGRARER